MLITEQEKREATIEQMKFAAEFKSRFFQHWAILSGATLTLLIPFLQSIKSENIATNKLSKINLVPFLLITSLILSSIEILMSSWGYQGSAKLNLDLKPKEERNQSMMLKILSVTKRVIEIIAIFSYIIAVVMLSFFLSEYLMN